MKIKTSTILFRRSFGVNIKMTNLENLTTQDLMIFDKLKNVDGCKSKDKQ